MSEGKKGGGKGERGKQTAAQKKRTSTTFQAPTKQPASLAADAFASALAAMPSEDCLPACLPADRTIMLRMASKRVREVVDKARLRAVVCLSRSFWVDARNGTVADRLTHIFCTACYDDEPAPHHQTGAAALSNPRTRCSEACSSAGAVRSAGAP